MDSLMLFLSNLLVSAFGLEIETIDTQNCYGNVCIAAQHLLYCAICWFPLLLFVCLAWFVCLFVSWPHGWISFSLQPEGFLQVSSTELPQSFSIPSFLSWDVFIFPSIRIGSLAGYSLSVLTAVAIHRLKYIISRPSGFESLVCGICGHSVNLPSQASLHLPSAPLIFFL